MLLSPTLSDYKALTTKELIALLIERDARIAAYEQDIVKVSAQLKEVSRILALRNKKIFGTSSEKSRVVIKDQTADYIAYEQLHKATDPLQEPVETVIRHQEKRVYQLAHPGRYAIPEHIRREEHHIYPDQYEPGWNRELPPQRTERLSLKIELIAEVTIRHKFARGEQIVMAPFPINDPFYKYKVTVDLVATQMMLRFALHIPYYRFRQLLPGCPVGYCSLINWAARAFNLLAPLRPVLHAEILEEATLLCMDETTFKLLDTPAKITAFKTSLMERGDRALSLLPANAAVEQLKKQTLYADQQPDEMEQELEKGISKGKTVLKGQMWALLNPLTQLVLFEFSPSRATLNAVLLLKDYQGLLMADAYSGYIRLAKLMEINITLLSCWAHARRYFLESQNPKHPDPVVKEIICRIAELYHIEKQVKGQSPRKKKRVRKRSRTVLKSLKIYLDKKIQLYAPKEAVAVAIQHCLNHWEALTAYTQYRGALIDNNKTERAIRPITINRKNVLFLGSVEHAAGAALMYSLMECCRMHKVDPYTWLLDVMKRIENHPKDQLADLLPHKWKKLNQCGKSPPVNT